MDFRAFSNLTADNQYATLGLMLLGCLARVRMVVRPFGKQTIVNEELIEIKADESVEMVDGNDLGEVIKREDIPSQKHALVEDESDSVEKELELRQATKKTKKIAVVGDEPSKKRKVTVQAEATEKKTTTLLAAKPPKKKRKKGDAFDDLFSGLV